MNFSTKSIHSAIKKLKNVCFSSLLLFVMNQHDIWLSDCTNPLCAIKKAKSTCKQSNSTLFSNSQKKLQFSVDISNSLLFFLQCHFNRVKCFDMQWRLLLPTLPMQLSIAIVSTEKKEKRTLQYNSIVSHPHRFAPNRIAKVEECMLKTSMSVCASFFFFNSCVISNGISRKNRFSAGSLCHPPSTYECDAQTQHTQLIFNLFVSMYNIISLFIGFNGGLLRYHDPDYTLAT